jgi:hypothetical protein
VYAAVRFHSRSHSDITVPASVLCTHKRWKNSEELFAATLKRSYPSRRFCVGGWRALRGICLLAIYTMLWRSLLVGCRRQASENSVQCTTLQLVNRCVHRVSVCPNLNPCSTRLEPRIESFPLLRTNSCR